MTLTNGANPVPVTITKVPGGPLVSGPNVIFGPTVNNAEAVFISSSAVTVYVPFGVKGTPNLASKEPNMSVSGFGVGVTSSPSNVRVMGLDSPKP